MDIQSTVTRVKGEYKDYLRKTHPDWADSTVSTHVSDAFYLYQNTIALSFWKCFADAASMAAAQQDLLDYLKNEAMSDRAEERAKGYDRDLTMLKEFLDSKGGVRQYIGYEYDCEVAIYQYAKRVYDGELGIKDAVKTLGEEVPCFGEGSHKFTVGNLFPAMMSGKHYTWKANTELTAYFITHIGQDYGRDKLGNALRATLENIKYYYGQTGNKSTSIRRSCRKIAEQNNIDISFEEDIFDGIIPKESSDSVLATDTAATRYWLYAAGDSSANWESDYAEGIMAIGWPGMGDLSAYSSKEEMRAKMRELYGGTSSYKNQVLATWQFANEIKPGDVVFVKKGLKRVVGRGVVEGEYIYDKQRGEFCHIRKVRWTDKGEWEHPDQYVMKTLTDMTPYTDFLKKMQALFDEGKPEEILGAGEEETAYDSYTADDFLQDVYMDEERYQTLKALLLTKKNIILQGAPGVGKTFAAKRLAYSIMGEKDTSRTESAGAFRMMEYLDDQSMAKLYEKFILGYYQRKHPALKVHAPQIKWAVTGGHDAQLPIMQTDIVLSSRETGKTLIIDAKYYSHNMRMNAPYMTRTIHSNNLYQIFAYVKNWPAAPDESVAGMLLYAGTDDEVQPDNDYQISGNTISVKTLDLDCDFTDIAKKLDAIAEGVASPGKRTVENVV